MATTSLPNGHGNMTGSKAQYRRNDLRPRLRHAPRGTGMDPQPTTTFNTNIGLIKLPQRISALRPNAPMIKEARHGVLSGFLRDGQIIPASYLGSIVDPKTAILTLTDSVEMETDHLSDDEERMPASERSLENLFYICVREDELPSYHFWRSKTDPDPFKVHKKVNRDRDFNHEPRLEAETGAFVEYEQAKRRQYDEPAVATKSVHVSSVRNDWSEGGKYYREKNPKRNSQFQSENLGKAAKEAQWRPQGALFNIAYHTSDQRNLHGSGQFGPQPGDPEWEKVESGWEQRLVDNGLEQTMRDIERDDPQKYRELTKGKTSSIIKPTRGDDVYGRMFNEVAKTMVPTVAFKLTQQHFNRPTSPLNLQEPLVRGRDPNGWGLHENEAHEFGASYEKVQHEVGELEFLNFYDEKSNGELMLRRRKRIPEEHIHRELNNSSPFDDDNYEIWNPQKDTTTERCLIHGDLGGLYLYDSSYKGFCEVARRLVAMKPNPATVRNIEHFYVFVNHVGDANGYLQPYELEIDSGESTFMSKILPELRKSTVEIKVRGSKVSDESSFHAKVDSSFLKVTAPHIGYCYTHLKLGNREDELHKNSEHIIESAIDFLFPGDPDGAHKRQGLFIVHVPGHGDYNIKLPSAVPVDVKLQEAFSNLIGMEVGGTDSPAEVFIYKSEDVMGKGPQGQQAKALRLDEGTQNEQDAALERANRILKAAKKQEQVNKMKRKQKVPPNQSTGAGLLPKSRLEPESVYKIANGKIPLSRYKSPLDWELFGGPDMPTVYARVPTLAEIRKLQTRVWHLENQILQREELCRVCDKAFIPGSSEIEEHYREHRLELVCPCCHQDWREKTRQEQIAHLALSHQLGALSVQSRVQGPTASESEGGLLKNKIVCTFNGCHAPLHYLTVEEQHDHAEMHARMKQLPKSPDVLNPGTLNIQEPMGTTILLGTAPNPPTAAKPPTAPKPTTPEHETIPEPTDPSPNPPKTPTTPKPTTVEHETIPEPTNPAPNPTTPETTKQRDPEGRLVRTPGQGLFCRICYANVTTLGITKQKTHASVCKTSVEEYLVLTKAEARRCKKASPKTPSGAAKAQMKRKRMLDDVYRPEPGDDSSSIDDKEKKRTTAGDDKTAGSRKKPRHR